MDHLPSTILIHKPVGLTPLQTIKKFQSQHPQYKGKKLGYAGRLDPMAQGLLLVLIGEENKHKHRYEQLDKTYEVTILGGISTDSYDLLGCITRTCLPPSKEQLRTSIKEILPSYKGNISLLYPPYSAYRVRGKPLYWWTRQQKQLPIPWPSQHTQVHDIDIIHVSELSKDAVSEYIVHIIPRISGDFRQEHIFSTWKTYLLQDIPSIFPLITLRISSKAGTYMRGIIHHMEKDLDLPLVAMNINRRSISSLEHLPVYDISEDLPTS